MTRRAFLQKYFFKFATVLAMLGLIVYALGHAMGNRANDILTTPVRSISDQRITTASAYLFRNEVLLCHEETGLVDELATSGTKVGKNVDVARIYPSDLDGEELAAAQRRLNDVNRAIRILQNSTVTGGNLSQAETYRTDAAKTYMEICTQIKNGSLDEILSVEENFLTDLNRFLILTGQETDTKTVLSQLQAQKEALLGERAVTLQNTASSGIYYGNDYVDGYETIFTEEIAKNLTEQKFEALCKSEPKASSGQTAGKMVYGYAWYAAMSLPQELCDDFEVGESYDMCFPENGGRLLTLTLERKDGTLAVFRSEDSPSNFIYYRNQQVQITVDRCEGFYIPDTALHTVGDSVGVYVLESSTARFRRVEILYSGDGYLIAARPQDSETCELYEYDVIITSGRNLYDGKVYQ